jgi:pyridoxine 5-phosphate synthase
MVEGAKHTGTDRIELYTEQYARMYTQNKKEAVAPFVKAAKAASKIGLGINAGHDLSLENLAYFAQQIPNLLEVSIGHALICDALVMGLEQTVKQYKVQLA